MLRGEDSIAVESMPVTFDLEIGGNWKTDAEI